MLSEGVERGTTLRCTTLVKSSYQTEGWLWWCMYICAGGASHHHRSSAVKAWIEVSSVKPRGGVILRHTICVVPRSSPSGNRYIIFIAFRLVMPEGDTFTGVWQMMVISCMKTLDTLTVTNFCDKLREKRETRWGRYTMTFHNLTKGATNVKTIDNPVYDWCFYYL